MPKDFECDLTFKIRTLFPIQKLSQGLGLKNKRPFKLAQASDMSFLPKF